MGNKGFFFFFVLSLMACYKPGEGCLDPNASNFDLAADKNCCCTYPPLEIFLNHTWEDTLPLKFNDTLVVDGQKIILLDFKFFLTEFSLYENSKSRACVDSITFFAVFPNKTPVSVTTTDDYLLASRNKNTYEAGTFPFPGSYDSVSFMVGLPLVAQFADPNTLPPEHPLFTAAESMRADNRFLAASLNLVRLSAQPDTLQLNLHEPLSLSLSPPNQRLLVYPGFKARIPLTIKYDRWFSQVDFYQEDSSIIQAVVKNTPNAFIWGE